MGRPMTVEHFEGVFSIDAALLGAFLDVAPARIQALMRRHEIISVCERGEGEHQGLYRLTFSYGRRRVRLGVDEAGRIVRRTVVDLGGQAPPGRKASRSTATSLPLWRMRPTAAPADPRWQGRRMWSEVVVRAFSAAMARHLAARWSRVRPRQIGNESGAGGSGFEDEGLYGIIRIDPADGTGEASAAAQDGVIRATPSLETWPPPPSEPDLIRVRTRRIACDGGGALGHPKVWYDLAGDEPLYCAYCSRRFVYDPEAAGPER